MQPALQVGFLSAEWTFISFDLFSLSLTLTLFTVSVVLANPNRVDVQSRHVTVNLLMLLMSARRCHVFNSGLRFSLVALFPRLITCLTCSSNDDKPPLVTVTWSV